MGLIKENKKINRPLSLIKSTLKVSEYRSVNDSLTGKKLQNIGLVDSSGKITKKGKLALSKL